jgi:hypothetical protein
MTEQELRMLVRDAIVRHGMGTPGAAREASDGRMPATFLRDQTSFSQFAVPAGPDGTCVIEPSVMCNHCGFCKSYGH